MTETVQDKLTIGYKNSHERYCLLVRKRLGMVIREHEEKRLEAGLAESCKHFAISDIDAFVERLENSPTTSPEWEYLVSQVTVGESYFFRDEAQFKFLRDEWLPTTLAEKRQRGDFSLRIWSAGCSDGQELYSLAIMLDQHVPYEENWNISFLGTDINTEALTTALNASYSKWSFRGTPKKIIEEYFQEETGAFALCSRIRTQARFDYINLAEDHFPSIQTNTSHLDLILCRNVFIYFSIETVRAIMKKFSDCLVSKGALLLGVSDPIENNIENLTLKETSGVLHFHKQVLDEPKLEVSIRVEEPIESINSIEIKSRHHELITNQPEKKSHEVKHITPEDDLLAQLNQQAQDFANQGDLDQAQENCKRCIDLAPLKTHAHYLSGLIYLEWADMGAAEAAFRKVLFLNRQHIEAHFQLGLLNIHKENRTAGLKNLHHALELAISKNPETCLEQSPDMTCGRFVEILKHEINIYESLDG